MPSLRELLEMVSARAADAGHPLPERIVMQIEAHIRSQWPAERVYIIPHDSRKDPDRAERIRRAAKKLPTGIVAQRFGVTDSWVRRIVKK